MHSSGIRTARRLTISGRCAFRGEGGVLPSEGGVCLLKGRGLPSEGGVYLMKGGGDLPSHGIVGRQNLPFEQTDSCENITSPQLRLAGGNKICSLKLLTIIYKHTF